MSINLVKGQGINLSKEVPNALSTLKASIGWEPNKYNTGGQFDLDISIFALEKHPTLEGEYLLAKGTDFCFYNNPISTDGSLKYSGDNRTGQGEGDDEYINIDLSKGRSSIINYTVVVSISDPNTEGHNFSMIDSYVRLINTANNQEIVYYKLSEQFTTETAVQVGSIYLENNEWKFKAMGAGYSAGLQDFINSFYYQGN